MHYKDFIVALSMVSSAEDNQNSLSGDEKYGGSAELSNFDRYQQV